MIKNLSCLVFHNVPPNSTTHTIERFLKKSWEFLCRSQISGYSLLYLKELDMITLVYQVLHFCV